MFELVYLVRILAERSAKSGPATGFLYVPFLRAISTPGSLFADAACEWFLSSIFEALLISVAAFRDPANLGVLISASIV